MQSKTATYHINLGAGNLTHFMRNSQTGYPAGLTNYMSLQLEAGRNRIDYLRDEAVYTHFNVEYDANGNVMENVAQGLTGALYDARNLPLQLQTGSGSIQYAYNAEGLRTEKRIGNTVTHYVRGKDGEVLASYVNNAIQSQPIYAGGEMIGNYDRSQRRYYIKDHLGSIRTTIDESGAVAGYDDYYPYGLTMPGRSSNTGNPSADYKFTGYEVEDDLGLNLYNANARLYDPVIGRFMQTDPLAAEYPGFSPYNYVVGNPIKFIDPTGKSIIICNGSGESRNCITYQAGMSYDGDNNFISQTIGVLNDLYSVGYGASVLESLISSNNIFKFKNSASSGGDRSFSFSPNKEGGGTINSMALLNPDISDGQKLESTAHELFHGYQHEMGQLSVANGINNEVGAGLFGKSVALTAGYPIVGAGTNTQIGQIYGLAFDNLLYGNSFNVVDYKRAINNFKQGSVANYVGNGIYNKYKVNDNLSNPVIKRFFPLIR